MFDFDGNGFYFNWRRVAVGRGCVCGNGNLHDAGPCVDGLGGVEDEITDAVIDGLALIGLDGL